MQRPATTEVAGPTAARPPATVPERRPALSAGDLLRTAVALGVQDAATLQLLTGQLGLGPRPRGAATAATVAPVAVLPDTPRIQPPPVRSSPAVPAVTTPGGMRAADAQPAAGLPGSAAQATLMALPPLQTAGNGPAWRAADAPAMARGALRPPPIPDPLFSPVTSRALGAAVAAVRTTDGEVDIDRLVTALASREPLRTLPRQPAWTLRRGLQVLVDTGAGMEPFDADVQQLLAVLARLIGHDRLQVQVFDGEPLHGAWPAAEGQAAGWQPPAPGVPVLVLSDFGIARPLGQPPLPDAAWRGFAEAAARGGHPLRALLPYAPSRWPARLPRSLHPLAWDRRTTVAAVRRLLAG